MRLPHLRCAHAFCHTHTRFCLSYAHGCCTYGLRRVHRTPPLPHTHTAAFGFVHARLLHTRTFCRTRLRSRLPLPLAALPVYLRSCGFTRLPVVSMPRSCAVAFTAFTFTLVVVGSLVVHFAHVCGLRVAFARVAFAAWLHFYTVGSVALRLPLPRTHRTLHGSHPTCLLRLFCCPLRYLPFGYAFICLCAAPHGSSWLRLCLPPLPAGCCHTVTHACLPLDSRLPRLRAVTYGYIYTRAHCRCYGYGCYGLPHATVADSFALRLRFLFTARHRLDLVYTGYGLLFGSLVPTRTHAHRVYAPACLCLDYAVAVCCLHAHRCYARVLPLRLLHALRACAPLPHCRPCCAPFVTLCTWVTLDYVRGCVLIVARLSLARIYTRTPFAVAVVACTLHVYPTPRICGLRSCCRVHTHTTHFCTLRICIACIARLVRSVTRTFARTHTHTTVAAHAFAFPRGYLHCRVPFAVGLLISSSLDCRYARLVADCYAFTAVGFACVYAHAVAHARLFIWIWILHYIGLLFCTRRAVVPLPRVPRCILRTRCTLRLHCCPAHCVSRPRFVYAVTHVTRIHTLVRYTWIAVAVTVTRLPVHAPSSFSRFVRLPRCYGYAAFFALPLRLDFTRCARTARVYALPRASLSFSFTLLLSPFVAGCYVIFVCAVCLIVYVVTLILPRFLVTCFGYAFCWISFCCIRCFLSASLMIYAHGYIYALPLPPFYADFTFTVRTFSHRSALPHGWTLRYYTLRTFAAVTAAAGGLPPFAVAHVCLPLSASGLLQLLRGSRCVVTGYVLVALHIYIHTFVATLSGLHALPHALHGLPLRGLRCLRFVPRIVHTHGCYTTTLLYTLAHCGYARLRLRGLRTLPLLVCTRLRLHTHTHGSHSLVYAFYLPLHAHAAVRALRLRTRLVYAFAVVPPRTLRLLRRLRARLRARWFAAHWLSLRCPRITAILRVTTPRYAFATFTVGWICSPLRAPHCVLPVVLPAFSSVMDSPTTVLLHALLPPPHFTFTHVCSYTFTFYVCRLLRSRCVARLVLSRSLSLSPHISSLSFAFSFSYVISLVSLCVLSRSLSRFIYLRLRCTVYYTDLFYVTLRVCVCILRISCPPFCHALRFICTTLPAHRLPRSVATVYTRVYALHTCLRSRSTRGCVPLVTPLRSCCCTHCTLDCGLPSFAVPTVTFCRLDLRLLLPAFVTRIAWIPSARCARFAFAWISGFAHTGLFSPLLFYARVAFYARGCVAFALVSRLRCTHTFYTHSLDFTHTRGRSLWLHVAFYGCRTRVCARALPRTHTPLVAGSRFTARISLVCCSASGCAFYRFIHGWLRARGSHFTHGSHAVTHGLFFWFPCAFLPHAHAFG